MLLSSVLATYLELKVKDIKMTEKEEDFFLKKFMELQQANAGLYKVLTDLYELENVKEFVDKKMPYDFLEFVKKRII